MQALSLAVSVMPVQASAGRDVAAIVAAAAAGMISKSLSFMFGYFE